MKKNSLSGRSKEIVSTYLNLSLPQKNKLRYQNYELPQIGQMGNGNKKNKTKDKIKLIEQLIDQQISFPSLIENNNQPHFKKTSNQNTLDKVKFKKGHQITFLQRKKANSVVGDKLLFKRFQPYCKPFKAWISQGNNRQLIKQILQKKNFAITKKTSKANLIWSSSKSRQYFAQRQNPIQIQSLYKDIKMHNHLEKHFLLSAKIHMYQNLKVYFLQQNYLTIKGQNIQKYVPLTFIIRNKQDLTNWKFYASSRNKVWIVKPGQNTNQGNGIFISQDRQTIQDCLKLGHFKKASVIQEYKETKLYKRRKFDFRFYVLVTYQSQSLLLDNHKAYWYNEGYVRTASLQYKHSDWNNQFIHLTNDSIQKWCQDFGKFEQRNKVSLDQIRQYLNEQNINFDQKYYQIKVNLHYKSIAKDVFNSALRQMNPKSRKNTFQIFGLDFILDSMGDALLLQINTNPCLVTKCKVLQKVIPKMVEDALQIAFNGIQSNIKKNNKFSILIEK